MLRTGLNGGQLDIGNHVISFPHLWPPVREALPAIHHTAITVDMHWIPWYVYSPACAPSL